MGRPRARPQQLLGKERVALAAGKHPLKQLRFDRPFDRVVQQFGHLCMRKPRQLNAFDIRTPGELGQQRPQRMTTVDVVRAVAEHQSDRPVRSVRAKNATRSRVLRSAQCASSMMNNTGAVSASATRIPCSASNNCTCARPSDSSRSGRATSSSRCGKRRDNTGRRAASARSSFAPSGMASSARKASTMGTYGSA